MALEKLSGCLGFLDRCGKRHWRYNLFKLLSFVWGKERLFFFVFHSLFSFTLIHPTSNPAAVLECRSRKLHLRHPFCFHNTKTSFPKLGETRKLSPQLTHGKVEKLGKLLQSFTDFPPITPRGWDKGAKTLALKVRFADHVNVLKQHPLTTSRVNQKDWKTFQAVSFCNPDC